MSLRVSLMVDTFSPRLRDFPINLQPVLRLLRKHSPLSLGKLFTNVAIPCCTSHFPLVRVNAALLAGYIILEMHHPESTLANVLLIHAFLLELPFDLITLIHKEVEELFRLLLHVSLIFVNENGLHDELIEPVEVFRAAGVNTLVSFTLLVGVKDGLVAAITA